MKVFSGYKYKVPAFKLNQIHNLNLDKDIKNEIQMQAAILAKMMTMNNSHSITLSDKKDYLSPIIRFFTDDYNFILSIDYREYKTYHVKFNHMLNLLDINSTPNDIKNTNDCASAILKALNSILLAIEATQKDQNKELLFARYSI